METATKQITLNMKRLKQVIRLDFIEPLLSFPFAGTRSPAPRCFGGGGRGGRGFWTMTEKSRRPAGSARTPSPPAPQRGLCLPRPWAPRPPPRRGSSQTQLCTHSDRPQPQSRTAEPHRGGRGGSRVAESEDGGREAPRAAPTGSPLLSSDDR